MYMIVHTLYTYTLSFMLYCRPKKKPPEPLCGWSVDNMYSDNGTINIYQFAENQSNILIHI